MRRFFREWRTPCGSGGPTARASGATTAAGLAIRRLAIIDLHERSTSRCTRALHLVFNGEIYNYVELRDELRGLGHVFLTRATPRCCCTPGREWGRTPRPPQRDVRVRHLG